MKSNLPHLTESDDGRLYGSGPVLLTKIVNRRTVTIIGSTSPFASCIIVSEYKGENYVEKPYSYWESEGFAITVDSGLLRARELSRAEDRGEEFSESPFSRDTMTEAEFEATFGKSFLFPSQRR